MKTFVFHGFWCHWYNIVRILLLAGCDREDTLKCDWSLDKRYKGYIQIPCDMCELTSMYNIIVPGIPNTIVLKVFTGTTDLFSEIETARIGRQPLLRNGLGGPGRLR